MYWTEFLTIAAAHLLAVASPGPDFAVVLKQSVLGGIRAGLWTSLGVGSAILLHVAYCLFGVAFLLSQSPGLFNAMKLIAALYLFYLGAQSIRNSFLDNSFLDNKVAEPSHSTVVLHPGKAFVLGFLTNGLNPKATLFFLALFTVIIDASTPTAIQLMYGLYLAAATFIWFALLSTMLGISRVRLFILSLGVWIERAMGAILLLLALQIAFTV